MDATGFNNTTLKQTNRGIVFQMIATGGGISRSELAVQSHLSKMAVSNIVAEFLERGLVTETEYTGKRKLARKPMILKLSEKTPMIAGVLLHRSHVSAVLCDCHLNVLRSQTLKITACDETAYLDAAFRVTDAVMAGRPVLGIGIGAIGPVDITNGMILNPPQFFGLRDIPVKKLFEERYELPVYLDYHYNCTALAEKYFGNGQNYHSFLFLGLTEGLGCGIIMGNRLFSSYSGFSSEFGHIVVDPNGPACSCGNRGCVGRFLHFSSEEEIQSSMSYLATALTGICNFMIPQAIIIGDEQSRIRDEHLKAFEKTLNGCLVVKNYHHIDVLRAYRSKDMEASGCAVNVVKQIFDGKLLFE